MRTYVFLERLAGTAWGVDEVDEKLKLKLTSSNIFSENCGGKEIICRDLLSLSQITEG